MSVADDRSAPVPLATGRLGMWFLLAALTMVFGSTTIGYLVVRSRAEAWPPPGMPSLPSGLWLSTFILLVSSVTMHIALRAARRDDQRWLCLGMTATTLLGLGFLASQFFNWFVLMAEAMTPQINLYGFTFYLLTGLHAAHVIGGLIPLAVVTTRAWQGRYSATFHPGVVYCSMYWHFLDVVWIILFITFLTG